MFTFAAFRSLMELARVELTLAQEPREIGHQERDGGGGEEVL
jgi:hypothetical protein